MAKLIIKILKFVALFLFFWFLNNGFLVDPIWQVVQATFFALVTTVVFKYTKIKLKYWICLVGLCYVASGVFEIFKILIFPEIMASAGFGVLVILIISRVLVRGD